MLGASNHSNSTRVEHDYYATDPTAIDDLLAVEEFNENILEPSCGEGHLSKRLISKGHSVKSMDLIDRGYGDEFCDFLNCDTKWAGDIITNPPYKFAREFVDKSLSITNKGAKIAMFLKITFLESQGRRDLFDKNPPKIIYVYSKRKKVARNGSKEMFKKPSAICYCWFVWENGYKGDTILKWI